MLGALGGVIIVAMIVARDSDFAINAAWVYVGLWVVWHVATFLIPSISNFLAAFSGVLP